MIQNLATQEMLNALKAQVMKEQFDEKYPVGNGHYIQFQGMGDPSVVFAKYGATWTIDADYSGRVLVGQGTGYALGAVGGEATHSHALNDSTIARLYVDGYSMDYDWVSGVAGWTSVYENTIPSGQSSLTAKNRNAGIRVSGATVTANFMPPYKVVAVWKRTA